MKHYGYDGQNFIDNRYDLYELSVPHYLIRLAMFWKYYRHNSGVAIIMRQRKH